MFFFVSKLWPRPYTGVGWGSAFWTQAAALFQLAAFPPAGWMDPPRGCLERSFYLKEGAPQLFFVVGGGRGAVFSGGKGGVSPD